MCLLLIAVDVVPKAPLLLLGNRDEFHARATAPSQPWSEDARVVGGRDLVAGGSWLAVRGDGRFAAVTNLRTGVPATAPRSRGDLVRDFVLGDEAPERYLQSLRAVTADFGPFNLVVGDAAGALALGSSDRRVRELGAGVHVISNGPIGVHWPKTERLQRRFEQLAAAGAIDDARLLDLLYDETQPPDAALPDTGVGQALERVLAPVFIRGERYGTRASSLVLRAGDGTVALRERRFGPLAAAEGESLWRGGAEGGFVGVPL
ncbi:NRDE family protein [Dokdonella sp.]|uniref:NRDE family protein n=1 Tax=Dokdonella sp. TaxID=2291710 RepID=UPI001B066F53|nr:NRDE family protein [Dokdonella sp.]MBO9664717.1 NRDE family protein [Dokdonella sp.]